MCSSRKIWVFSSTLEESMSDICQRIDHERVGEYILTERLEREILLASARPHVKKTKGESSGRR